MKISNTHNFFGFQYFACELHQVWDIIEKLLL